MAEPNHLYLIFTILGPIEHWEGLGITTLWEKGKSLHPIIHLCVWGVNILTFQIDKECKAFVLLQLCKLGQAVGLW